MQGQYDAVIVGGGPAGLTAALYLARARYRVAVLERERIGGQIALTEEVDNYPGVAQISGESLTQTMKVQAEHFGAEILTAEATGYDLAGPIKTIQTSAGPISCTAVLLATGAQPRKAGFLGEDAYKGRGVAYCATSDGAFFTGKDVFVVGGGYAAAEESVFLTKFARHVTILVRKPDFSCAASVAEKARNHEKITVLTNTVLEEVSGDRGLTYARYRNTQTGEVTEYRAAAGESFGVFVFTGYAPATEGLENQVSLDDQGHILTDENLQTSQPGVFAAGDVRVKSLRQVVTATADGALAATAMEGCLAKAKPQVLEKRETPKEETVVDGTESGLFTPDLRRQTAQLLAKLEEPLVLRLFLDQRPISRELEAFALELEKLTGKLRVERGDDSLSQEERPCVQICRRDGAFTGLAFHGVPGGHEFSSFLLGLLNAGGPGQPVAPDLAQKIQGLQAGLSMKVLVTLSCGMCPELVTAAQLIAARNPGVTAEVYDVTHFSALREQYQVMSVPCLVVNDDRVSFGKKTLAGLLAYLE